MKRYLRFDTILLIIASLLTVMITELRVVSHLRGYDAAAGYFLGGLPYYRAANILTAFYMVAALALSVVSCFGKLAPGGDPKHARYSALITGAVTFFFAVTQLSDRTESQPITLTVGCVFTLFGLFYFFSTFLLLSRLNYLRGLGALCMVCFGILYTLYFYFMDTLPINGHLKILHIFAVLTFFMFYLSEARRALGRSKEGIAARFFALCCFMMCTSVGVTDLIGWFLYPGDLTFMDYTHPLLLSVTGIYAFVRLFYSRATETQATNPKSETINDLSPEEETPDGV